MGLDSMRVRSADSDDVAMRRDALTCRESELIDLLAQGLSRKELAQHLNLSIHTVNSHIEAIYRKLSVHNRALAVAKAFQAGSVPRQK